MEQVKTIRLLGAAGRKFGRKFRVAVKSPAEAVRALMALRPEFKAWVLDQHQRGVVWRVVTDRPEGIDDTELDRETGSETIVLAPVIQGAGGSGGSIFKIILGVVLIAVAIAVPAAAFGLTSMLSVGLIGGGLVLSGIADLITPTPQLSGPKASGGPSSRASGTAAARSADLESNLFSRNQGTGGQGECVPLLYGQRRVSSPRVISFDLRNLPDSRDIDVAGTAGLLGYVNQRELT